MNVNSRHFILLLLLVMGLFLTPEQSVLGQSSPFATPSGSGTPQVTSHTTNANQVGRYQKFEVTFQLNRVYPPDSFLPYYYYDPADARGVDGITIDGHFVAPSGRELVVPAFYYQDYVRSGTNQVTLTPGTTFAWKLRFAPEEQGTYSYFITVLDKNGSTRYPASGALQFQAVPSDNKGFVRVSPRDSRFLEFSNGESFVPNSAGRQWWMPGSALRSLDYDNTFAEFGRNGINLTRIWDQNDGYALTVEGHFDAYKYPDDFNPQDRGVNIAALPKGTQMNQRGNYEEDKIIEAAERNGVYIILSSHEDAYWIWDASVHNQPPASWADPARQRYWQRNFRYRVARWGYSTAVMAWELWNEHGHVPVNSDIYRFYQTYSQYQQQTDPFRHLRTTSQGSQAWSAGFWSSPAFDIASYHDYMMISRYGADLTYDAANFVYRFAQCLRLPNTGQCGLGLGDGSTWQGAPKPIFWGELDTGTSNWNEANPQPKATHDMRWAGLFSPIGMSPIDWYFNKQSAAFTATKYREAKIASDFFRGVDYAGKVFSYLSTADVRLTSEVISTSSPQFRVLAMRARSGAEAYAWVQHKGNARWDQSAVPAPLSATFTLSGMAVGSYRIEVWDTYTGQITDGGTVTANNGQVVVPVTNLSKDVAIKILPVNAPPTATPLPASPVPTATSVLPTATLPPTATSVLPTATLLPTHTPVPPTATAQPPTLAPTMTDVPASPTAPPDGEAGVRIEVVPLSAAPGETIDVMINLVNVSNLYGLETVCTVDPAILAGVGGATGAFDQQNSFIATQPYSTTDGSWRVAATRIRPNPPINGSSTAFTLRYQVLAAGESAVNCTVNGVDPNGWTLPLAVTNGIFNSGSAPVIPSPTAVLPPTPTADVPPVLPTETVPVPTATVPAPTSSRISGSITYPGRTDHSGVTVALYALDTLAAEVVTTTTGAYQFTDVPLGVYILRFDAPQSLTLERQVLVETDGSVKDVGTDVLPVGDADSNQVIDLTDAALIGANYGLEGAVAPASDLNRDNIINISDLVLIGANFGLVGPVVVP